MYRITLSLMALVCLFAGPAITGTLFETPVTYLVGEDPRALCAADFDDDGFADLAVANLTSDNISILFNDQTGAFGLAVNYAAGTDPSGICAADFDDDNYLDLAVTNMLSDNVSIYLNDGFGVFAAAVNYATGIAGAHPDDVCAADFDDDGFIDLAIANEWADSVAVLFNNQDGTFQTPATSYHLGVGTLPYSVCAADFDDDGFIDLAVANSGTDDIAILINDQDGAFALSGSYPAGDSPRSLSSADLDDDGFPDLAVASYGSHDVTVLINEQDGTFAAAVPYNAGSNPRWVCLVELNGDTDIDIAAVNRVSNDASIYINNGDGTFPVDDVYSVGSNPTSVCSADFDGDTDNDLAICLLSVDSVAILMNTTMPEVDVDNIAGDGLPGRLGLAQNYPNPFNPGTRIEFSLPQRSNVVISVFNINGQLVRHLLNEELAAGDHVVSWDGCDDSGGNLATGIYLYRLNAGESIQTRKMVLLK